jgi:TPR repeat protein
MKRQNLAAIKTRLAEIGWPWKHQYERARLLKQAVALGDIDVLDELGGCYREGMRDKGGRLIIGPNKKTAERYYQKAAERGSAEGMVCLADALSSPQRLARLAGPARRRSISAAVV